MLATLKHEQQLTTKSQVSLLTKTFLTADSTVLGIQNSPFTDHANSEPTEQDKTQDKLEAMQLCSQIVCFHLLLSAFCPQTMSIRSMLMFNIIISFILDVSLSLNSRRGKNNKPSSSSIRTTL
jgi:hypothetical protein